MINKKNILVTGANGQLGMEFRALEEQYKSYRFLFVSKEQLSIDNREAVEDFFYVNHIACCINCAAYTAVDKAETEQETAEAINATAAGTLAAICKKYDALFIHFSTDYVFNGQATAPYKETDATDPVNRYGASKLHGEKEALENNSSSIIIRTSWVYSSYGKNFVKTMLRLMHEKESISVVNDQLGCPTFANDLADAVMQIIKTEDPQPGIYHYCNAGITSWYEFALAIREISNASCEVKPVPTTQYPTPAKRPQYSVLDTTKFTQAFKIEIPFWKDSLKKCMAQLL